MKLKNLLEYAKLNIFNYGYRPSLVHQVLTSFIDLSHQGTKKQKLRSEVSGGNSKPWRQKGTGRARAGSTRSPLWRTGGVTFAANGQPSRKLKINKKMYRGSIKSILSHLYVNCCLNVFEDLNVMSHKTRDLPEEFKKNSTLVILKDLTLNIALASRNVNSLLVISSEEVNPNILVNYQNIFIEKDALDLLEERLS